MYGTKLYKLGTKWDSNSLVKICKSSLLTITPPKAPGKHKRVVIYYVFLIDVAQNCLNWALDETRTRSWRFASLAC